MPAIPGYRLGDPALPPSSLSLAELDELRASLLLGSEDMRHLLALAVPITLTVRPFLAAQGASPAEIDTMHAAWHKAVLLQAILWSRPYTNAGDF